MSLELVASHLASVSESARFSVLTIRQNRDGVLSLETNWDIDVSQDGGKILSTETLTLGMGYDQIKAEPDFPAAYASIRNTVRAQLKANRPDLVA